MAVDHETLLGWLTPRLTAIRDQLHNLLGEAAEKKLTQRRADDHRGELGRATGCGRSVERTS